VAAAPTRPELLFELLRLCQSSETCDSRIVEERLRRLDPDNGISWTYAMLRADVAHNESDRNAARDGLARAKRVDVYWNKTVSRLTAAAAGHAGFDARAALVEVIGIEAAFMSALQPVSRACAAQEIQEPAVLVQCRQIAAAFRQGDTMLFESYGSSLALQLWPEGSAERAAIAAERRTLHYRMDLMTRNAAKIDSAQATEAMVGFLGRYPTEQTAFRALYLDLGLNPDPPANWVDRWPGGS
jgi:hypothetical protein